MSACSLQEAALESHELVTIAAELGVQLAATLVEMLDEHHSHRTERRGCGFTQATRHLAALINLPRGSDFAHRLFASVAPEAPLDHILNELLLPRLQREESHILARLIIDLLAPRTVSGELPELALFSGEIRVGTCPLAEKYFLEISDRFIRRRGRVNVLVSAEGQPLLLEKLGLGEDHSCVSVAPMVLNGVRLPPGCLFGVARNDGIALCENKALPGSIIPVDRCDGFRFLRLTTLAVSPANRRRAFTSHFQAQLDAGLFAPGEATIAQLECIAREQLPP